MAGFGRDPEGDICLPRGDVSVKVSGQTADGAPAMPVEVRPEDFSMVFFDAAEVRAIVEKLAEFVVPGELKAQYIPVESERWTANVCFGGKEQKTLFITASEYLYAVKMRVHGVTNP